MNTRAISRGICTNFNQVTFFDLFHSKRATCRYAIIYECFVETGKLGDGFRYKVHTRSSSDLSTFKKCSDKLNPPQTNTHKHTQLAIYEES